METVTKLDVYIGDRKVGTMAPYQRYRTAFEYSREWLSDGYSISPFSLPLREGIHIAKIDPFDGLFGIFADSLPDGWGRLLVDRMLRREGENPETIDSFTRLAIVGNSGMGALEYRPAFQWSAPAKQQDYDRLAEECRKILRSEESDDLDNLYALGGSSGGARPKVLLKIDGEDWIVKFPSSMDPEDIGLMEYEYMVCALECGLEVPECRLLPGQNSAGYFACRRFDRHDADGITGKVHMASASGLLEVSHRIPSLDYNSLMALTWQLTRSMKEVEKMYRLMCFNVFAHNRDDHSNNFSYLCEEGVWKLAPAYDLTYSWSLHGEHATTINGEGREPSNKDILQVAEKAGIKRKKAVEIAGFIQETVQKRLGKYLFADR